MKPTVELLAELPMVGPEGYDPFWDEIKPEVGHYDRNGEPISMRTWCRLRHIEEPSYIRVTEDTVGPYWISTVWIGIDHGWRLVAVAPLIFETMVFNRETDESDLDCRRYVTEAEALAGHARVVEEVRLIVAATS